jgi:uroporphyrinogen-III synthase
MRLLVTRPETDAARTAEALRARGHEVLAAPLLRVESIGTDFGGPFDAVLMTSANAARVIASHPRAAELTRLPVFTVGDRSAEAARAAGFARVESADGALADLARLVASRCPRGTRLIYLAGEDRAGDPGGELGEGFAVETAAVYRAVAIEQLPPEIARVPLDGVLHYSRRSAATLLRLAERAGALGAILGLAHYCLSDDVAAPLRHAGAERIAVAAAPTESALWALLK